jgi:hypothetical protein
MLKPALAALLFASLAPAAHATSVGEIASGLGYSAAPAGYYNGPFYQPGSREEYEAKRRSERPGTIYKPGKRLPPRR